MYANFGAINKRDQTTTKRTDSFRRSTEPRTPARAYNRNKSQITESNRTDIKNRSSERRDKKENVTEYKADTDNDKDSQQKKHSSIKRKQRTEKLATPDYTNESRRTSYDKPHRRTNLSPYDKIYENNTTEKLKTEHRSRSSHRHSTSTKPVTVELVPKDSSKIVKEDSKPSTLEKQILENGGVKHRTRASSKDKTSDRKESPKGRHRGNTDSYRTTSSSRANKEILIPERVPNGTSDSHRSKRSEYVINYDDKKGTVSSICKVTGSGSSKKKKILKDSPKEYKDRNKTTEKISLRK